VLLRVERNREEEHVGRALSGTRGGTRGGRDVNALRRLDPMFCEVREARLSDQVQVHMGQLGCNERRSQTPDRFGLRVIDGAREDDRGTRVRGDRGPLYSDVFVLIGVRQLDHHGRASPSRQRPFEVLAVRSAHREHDDSA